MPFSVGAIYRWYRDTIRNPKYRWWIILGTVTYLVSPFDIAPDLIPFIGEIDDVALVTLLVAELSQIWVESFKARQESKGPRPKDSGEAAAQQTIEVDAVPMQDQK